MGIVQSTVTVNLSNGFCSPIKRSSVLIFPLDSSEETIGLSFKNSSITLKRSYAIYLNERQGEPIGTLVFISRSHAYLLCLGKRAQLKYTSDSIDYSVTLREDGEGFYTLGIEKY